VVGESMEPTLINGDNVLMEKLSYIAGKPKRYDIVVFPRDGALLIKRVYGLPGENIRIDESGMIYINGEPLDDRHAHEIMDNPGLAGGDGVTLDKGEYFVLGDNRNNSVDSRYEMVGAVSKKDIRGRVVWRLTPFDRLGKIK
ncbi:MAG: signal peptidase I, partial [Lachnospiraceae bacterium]|nr:signal peptidase I [Lachnospiraceae bacterium]